MNYFGMNHPQILHHLLKLLILPLLRTNYPQSDEILLFFLVLYIYLLNLFLFLLNLYEPFDYFDCYLFLQSMDLIGKEVKTFFLVYLYLKITLF